MNKKHIKRLKRLRRLLLKIRRAAEHAEAQAAELNSVASQVARVGIIPEQAVVGKLIFVRDYSPPSDESNSVQVWQAALLLPEGLGAIVRNSNEYLDLGADYEPSVAEARWHFVPFDRCPLVAKALLSLHTEALFEKVIDLIDVRDRWLQPLKSEYSEDSA
jgi:hypothetical protein